MTKKLLIAFIALGLIYGVTTFLFHVFDDDEIDASYFRYLTNGNDTITITDYEGGHKALNFPSEIEGDPVVEINIPSLSAEDHETEIETIKFPSTLETITDFDFFRRENLRSIEVASGNDHFASEDGILYSADKSELIAVPIKKNIPEFTVPASVREIGSLAFYRNDSLTILDFERGSKLESIGPYAFDDAENLESVTFPEGLKTISGAAFSDTRIKKVELPESLRAIGTSAFGDNEHLSEITFNEGLEVIGVEAFAGGFPAAKVATIELPSTLKEIGAEAFDYLEVSGTLHIPKNVEIIGERAFAHNRIDTLTFADESRLEVIGKDAFSMGEFEEVRIPKSVELIEDDAFFDVEDLTVVLPESNDGSLVELEETDSEYPSPFKEDVTIVVPDTLYDDYFNAPVYEKHYQDALIRKSEWD